MDPFSIVVGSISLVDVCARLFRYLKDFESAVAGIDQEIRDLLHHIDTVALVVNSIKDAFGTKVGLVPDTTEKEQGPFKQLWQNAGKILRGCQGKMEKLEVIVKEIKGKDKLKGPSKIDGFMKQLRKQSRDEEYRNVRSDLNNFLQTLQTLLQIIELSYHLRSQSTSDQLSHDIREIKSKLDLLSPDLKLSHELRDAVDSAKAMVRLVSANKHFQIPQRVSSIFTGREAQLEELKVAFFGALPAGQRQTQRRFVISGLGGSGKTQFSCKFAEDNRKQFWGVFWINASSAKSAKQTLSGIAKRYGAREPNESAAKDWLSNLELPWLLIIDDAASDDAEVFDLGTLFPEGERGYILITTRDESHKVHGTVGPRSFQFGNMDSEPATDLLLKAACLPEPWDPPTKESALRITEVLGYLPLALVYAGRAIMEGLCTLQDYIKYYTTSWQRIDKARSESDDDPDQDLYMSVYSGFEIVYLALKDKSGQAASDALELLNMFAFLSNEEIKENMLEQAAKNPSLERGQEEMDRQSGKPSTSRQKSWSSTWTEIKLKALIFLFQDRSPPVLPRVLRDSELSPFDMFRLRRALRELSRRSLIMRNSTNKSYSMHPIIHTWVRERPEMTREKLNMKRKGAEDMEEVSGMTCARPEMRTGRQAVWCQAAATTLSQAVLLPPLGDQAADEDFRRDLLPHIDFLQKRQAEIREQISRNQRSGKWLWAVQPTFTRREALQLAKYSRIYAQCGLWPEAAKLQTIVSDFVCGFLGTAHPSAIRIQLALSVTYQAQGRGTDAAKLQEKLLNICTTSLGGDDPSTLKIMDALGQSKWGQGRFNEAKELHQTAIERLTRTLGGEHEDTLRATDHLGHVQFHCLQYQQAKELHSTALIGMRKAEGLGPGHLDTLTAQENLAMSYMLMGGDSNLAEAHELMVDVVEKRREKLGKEHPWTLLCRLNFARVRGAQGFYDEAEKEIRTGLEVARRNLGPDNIGTLFGEARLGQLLLRQGRYREAEELLQKVPRYYKGMATASDGSHPDRLIAMLFSVHCYRLQHNFEAAINICDDCITRLESIESHDHPFLTQFKHTRDVLSDPQDRGSSLSEDWKVR